MANTVVIVRDGRKTIPLLFLQNKHATLIGISNN